MVQKAGVLNDDTLLSIKNNQTDIGSMNVLSMAFIYVYKIAKKFTVTENNVRPLFFACSLISIKLNSDTPINMRSYAKYYCMDFELLCRIEQRVLEILDFRVQVGKKEMNNFIRDLY